MGKTPNRANEQLREAILASSALHADTALWNYVSILSWLRALRAIKVVAIIIPAILGGLASRYSIDAPQNSSLIAAFAALAGFFPVVYVALGLDQTIGYYSNLAGKNRLFQTLFSNLLATAGRYTDDALVAEYDRVFSEYCRVREEAYTVPRRYFVLAKKVIDEGEYTLLGRSPRSDPAELKSGRDRPQAHDVSTKLPKENPAERG